MHCALDALPGETVVREAQIERHLVELVHQKGGKAFKFVSPTTAGVSDRLVLMPVPPEHRELVQRYVKLVEVKRPGERPRPLQVWFMQQIAQLGHAAAWVDGRASIEALFE